jgi:hypothetical protein
MANSRKSTRHPGPPPPTGAADGLFTSTQERVLAYLYGQPDRAFYLRELVELTGAGNGAVQRELQRLQQSGLVCATRERGRIWLQADARSPIHDQLAALVRRSFGLAEPLRRAFAPARPCLQLCFAFEPARDPYVPASNDLGVLLMEKPGWTSSAAIDAARDQAEEWLGRGIWILSVDVQRLHEDPFVAKVLRRPRVWVYGDEMLLD